MPETCLIKFDQLAKKWKISVSHVIKYTVVVLIVTSLPVIHFCFKFSKKICSVYKLNWYWKLYLLTTKDTFKLWNDLSVQVLLFSLNREIFFFLYFLFKSIFNQRYFHCRTMYKGHYIADRKVINVYSYICGYYYRIETSRFIGYFRSARPIT